jgi:hypothetical protein
MDTDTNFFASLACSNRVYSNCTIETVTPATVTIFYAGGGDRISITNLPPDLQKRYHYDPAAAEQYLAAQATKKGASQAQQNRAIAAIAGAMRTLGPAQHVRLVRIAPDNYVEIEVDGVTSEASIHGLPADILPLIRELTDVEAGNAAFKASEGDRGSGPPQRGSAFRQSAANARNEQRGTTAAAMYSLADVKAAQDKLIALRKRFRERRDITARPTGYFPYAHARLWEFQGMAPQ